MMLSCIVIEDEPLATEKIKGFIQQVPFLNLLGCFPRSTDGLFYLKTNLVDLIFLDIQMEQLTGIQLLQTLSQKPYVIITSAYSDYALKGYELRVFDYLLKPYSFERFLSAVNRVFDDALLKVAPVQDSGNIFVKTEYRLENILVDDILYIEGMREYLRIHLADRKIMTKQSFSSLLTQLPLHKFARVHKSWAVAISRIQSIERNRIVIDGKYIPVGDSYKDGFLKQIKM